MEIELPLRLGYFLEFTEPREPYLVFGRMYRGVDRTLAYIGDDFLERASAKTFPKAWEEYWEAEDEHGVLIEPKVARRCCDALLDLGVPNETVYAEVVSVVEGSKPFDDPTFFNKRHELIRRPDVRTHFLGHDISGAMPTFHSYLNNPGLDQIVPELADLLNENALVPRRDVAEMLMRKAVELRYSRVPTVIAVWLIE